jgi:hypothetical protein
MAVATMAAASARAGRGHRSDRSGIAADQALCKADPPSIAHAKRV